MSKAPKATTRLEPGSGAALITQAVGARALGDLDARLAEAHQGLKKETNAGWDHEVTRLRAWALAHTDKAMIADTVELARRTRERFRVFVTVGIGGSDLAQRVLHDSLNNPYGNALAAAGDPQAGPEVYFTGNTFDPMRLVALLDMLEQRGMLTDTAFNVVSKSGRTSETISAMLLARERLIAAYARQARAAGVAPVEEAWRQNIVATTGPDPATSVLRRMHQESPFFGILPIPDGVGGRFSVVSPVGLLFLGVTAQGQTPQQRIAEAVTGIREAHTMFLSDPAKGANPAASLAGWLHLAETRCARNGIVLYNYADTPCIGEWFLQLYTESVQERGGGLSVTAVTGPTGNHSILNGIVGGPRDRIVVFIGWDSLGRFAPKAITIPRDTGVGGELEVFEGVPLDKAQAFSLGGTQADFTENGVPNVTLRVADRSPRSLFCLLRVLMDTVAIKGRLQNLHHAPDRAGGVSGELTYQQDGVEGYKKKTLALAAGGRKAPARKKAIAAGKKVR